MVLLRTKNWSLIFGAILFLFIGLILGQFTCSKFSICPIPPPTPIPTPTWQPLLTATPVSSPVSEVFKVIRVIDGDTLEIEPSTGPVPYGNRAGSGQGSGERVRYLGIDTPETVDPRKPVQCFGIEASKKNKELVEGKNVRLEKDITERDKYGRLLRYVWVDPSPPVGGSGQALFVNLELVRLGFAASYTYPPDVKYQAEILAAQQEAREANRGLWAACPLVSPAISESPSASNQLTTDCNIKGNISTSGEKIYHLPSCGSYAKTQIDKSRGERWFCSEEEAQVAGWRKALNCP